MCLLVKCIFSEKQYITQARKATNRTESEHFNICTFKLLNYEQDLAIKGCLKNLNSK